jgi:hypothetical protein
MRSLSRVPKKQYLKLAKKMATHPIKQGTTSEVFLQPHCIPNSKEEDLSVGGGSDSTQRSSSECIPVVDCLFRGTGTSVHDRVLCN